MAYPAIIFDGPDGCGKTTQSLLLASYLRQQGRKVTYVSFPVYETPLGIVIGRALRRWGEKESITLPEPEDMAMLFALNRLEIASSLRGLTVLGWMPILNRGPYGNIFAVARKVLQDKVKWEKLSEEEKSRRVNEILAYDKEFKAILQGDIAAVNLFLLLDLNESMILARQKALSTLGGEPDRHEESFELQKLAGTIYREITEGKILGHQAELVQATRGKTELEGIMQTAQRVTRIFCQKIGSNYEKFWSRFSQEIPSMVKQIREIERSNARVEFDFRKILGVYRTPWDEGFCPDLSTRRELMGAVFQRMPGVKSAVEASQRLDKEIRFHGKER